MDLGMIGLGRMGSNMVRRLLAGGHRCVVFDRAEASVQALVRDGAVGAVSMADLAGRLTRPRAVWLMVPAAVVDACLRDLVPSLEEDDIVIDGGNSHYADDIRRSRELEKRGIRYLDVGTSGGVWGADRGYCLMIGGPAAAASRLEAVFRTLAPGREAAAPTPDRPAAAGGTAEEGFLHCGASGAGHFVKMVHNGIEYGLMAAYAEGFNLLRHANAGRRERDVDSETAPLRGAEHYQYDFNVADIAELWRRGSVVASWLLDLTANALAKEPDLSGFSGRVSDSGEGRWTVAAAVETGSPVPVLSAALFQRFASRDAGEFGAKLLSAMRLEFGGHREKA